MVDERISIFNLSSTIALAKRMYRNARETLMRRTNFAILTSRNILSDFVPLSAVCTPTSFVLVLPPPVLLTDARMIEMTMESMGRQLTKSNVNHPRK